MVDRRTTFGPASVYPPREDTFLLLPYANVPSGTSLLEVGTGNGLLALTAARSGARVVATDLNLAALRSLRDRAREEGLDVTAVRTDLSRGLGRFDRILANPPYLPTQPAERDPDPDQNRALDGGPDGCRVTARIVDSLDRHLRPGGEAFVLMSSLQDPTSVEQIRARWWARNGRVRSVSSRTLEGERLEVWRWWVERD